MKTITIAQAFGQAPPRSAAVLCVRAPGGGVDMILTEWFSWLNMKRQPMLSYSMRRDAAFGLGADEGDTLVLAFPPRNEALCYKDGARVKPGGDAEGLPEGIRPVTLPNVPLPVPEGSEVVLVCTLHSSYRYPFKKVSIYNCNLEKALGTRV